jgi:hypothetical protein
MSPCNKSAGGVADGGRMGETVGLCGMSLSGNLLELPSVVVVSDRNLPGVSATRQVVRHFLPPQQTAGEIESQVEPRYIEGRWARQHRLDECER